MDKSPNWQFSVMYTTRWSVHCWLLLVGCDACPGRVKSKGPKVAYSLVNKKYSKLSSEALHHALANKISTMKGATVKYAAAVLHFANSLLYDKTMMGMYMNLQLSLSSTLQTLLQKIQLLWMVHPWECARDAMAGGWTSSIFGSRGCLYMWSLPWNCLLVLLMSKNVIEVLVGERLLCFECSWVFGLKMQLSIV